MNDKTDFCFMKNFITSITILITGIFLFTGCSDDSSEYKKPSIIGTWKTDLRKLDSATHPEYIVDVNDWLARDTKTYYTISRDFSESQIATTYSPLLEGLPTVVKQKMNYTVEGDTLVVEDVELNEITRSYFHVSDKILITRQAVTNKELKIILMNVGLDPNQAPSNFVGTYTTYEYRQKTS